MSSFFFFYFFFFFFFSFSFFFCQPVHLRGLISTEEVSSAYCLRRLSTAIGIKQLADHAVADPHEKFRARHWQRHAGTCFKRQAAEARSIRVSGMVIPSSKLLHYPVVDNFSLPCKTRKAKCDGCVPCECCQKRGAPCSYPSHAVVSQQHSQIPTAHKYENPEPQTRRPWLMQNGAQSLKLSFATSSRGFRQFALSWEVPKHVKHSDHSIYTAFKFGGSSESQYRHD